METKCAKWETKELECNEKKSLSKVLIRLFLFLMFIFECQNSSDLNKLFFLSTILVIEVKTH